MSFIDVYPMLLPLWQNSGQVKSQLVLGTAVLPDILCLTTQASWPPLQHTAKLFSTVILPGPV